LTTTTSTPVTTTIPSSKHTRPPSSTSVAIDLPSGAGGFNRPVKKSRLPIPFRILNQLNALMGRKNEHFELACTSTSAEANGTDATVGF
jgi:hypothetical protein